MKIKRLVGSALVILSSSYLSIATAEGYVGLAYGLANREVIDFTDDQEVVFNKEEKDNVFALYGGYATNENVAVEVRYSQLGKTSLTIDPDIIFLDENNGNNRALGNRQKVSSLSISGLYSFPVNNYFKPFIKLGLERWDAKTSFDLINPQNNEVFVAEVKEDGINAVYGLGAEFKISDNIALRAEIERYNGSKTTVATVGANFHF